MMKLYGAPMSSASRSRWMIEESGAAYEYEVVNIRDEAVRARYREVHPGLKIPYLVDDDVRLFESLAINYYVAEKYKPELMPATLVERALTHQWSFWAMTNLQPEALTVLRHTMMLPPDRRDAKLVEEGKAGCKRFLDQLEEAFDGEYLVGGRFTVADVNAGSVVNVAARVGGQPGPKVSAWLEKLRARPAFQKAYAM